MNTYCECVASSVRLVGEEHNNGHKNDLFVCNTCNVFVVPSANYEDGPALECFDEWEDQC